jgi:2'-5' RNA ligase
MLPKENLYFIAIIPSAEIIEAITAFKQDFADRFLCTAALKLVPHITLKAPFKLPPSEHAQLLDWFKKLEVPEHPFNTDLKGFDVFPKKTSPVIFVHVELNDQLIALQRFIIANFKAAYPNIMTGDFETNFRPHITIAYRDLKPAVFVEAWKEYQDRKYEAGIIVRDFHLLQHDEKKWNIISTYALLPGSLPNVIPGTHTYLQSPH